MLADAVIIVLQGGKPFVKHRKMAVTVSMEVAEYVIADSRYVGHLKSDVNFLEIALFYVPESQFTKGLKETETKPGEWVAISGIGGLGHVAVQVRQSNGNARSRY